MLTQFTKELTTKIQDAYEVGVTLPEAEKLAGEFLGAQLRISSELSKASLDSRMRKQGVKAIRAAVYMEAATKTDKKPSDMLLEQLVTQNEMVSGQQELFDKAEVELGELERLYAICREAHIFFRGISKGNFNG